MGFCLCCCRAKAGDPDEGSGQSASQGEQATSRQDSDPPNISPYSLEYFVCDLNLVVLLSPLHED